MHDLGYTIQALAPTVCLQLVGYLAATHESNTALAVLGGCRRARLLLELGATQAALKQLRALGGLGLTSKTKRSPGAIGRRRLLGAAQDDGTGQEAGGHGVEGSRIGN